MSDLASNLRALRARKNVSQDEVADSLHVDRKSISNWESGATKPNLSAAWDIADYYGVTLDDLIGRTVPVSA